MRFAKSPPRRRAQERSLTTALAALSAATSPFDRERALRALESLACCVTLDGKLRCSARYSRIRVSARRLLLNKIDALLEPKHLSAGEHMALIDLLQAILRCLARQSGRNARRWAKRYRLRRQMLEQRVLTADDLMVRYRRWLREIQAGDPNVAKVLLRTLSDTSSWMLRALAAQLLLGSLDRLFGSVAEMLAVDPAVRALPAAQRDPREIGAVAILLGHLRSQLGHSFACERSMIEQTLDELNAAHKGALSSEMLAMLRS